MVLWISVRIEVVVEVGIEIVMRMVMVMVNGIEVEVGLGERVEVGNKGSMAGSQRHLLRGFVCRSRAPQGVDILFRLLHHPHPRLRLRDYHSADRGRGNTVERSRLRLCRFVSLCHRTTAQRPVSMLRSLGLRRLCLESA